ncbi:hypothetical protein BSK54_10245 [Paenibacillus odorifer]|uniref:hypothetical protein n=1 Tax=Paenibacillus odorifer TaxID=189426 RepID=UPI00096DCD93|nr:hypothetical protein [Paenibacillus odorifer]OME02630.1 hypothetical protein BSK54_10245 [Paenibacillus odorifer]
MLMLNDFENLKLLLEEFSIHLQGNLSVRQVVKKRYYDDIRYYLFNIITRRNNINNFADFFNPMHVKGLYDIRTGDTVSAAIGCFLQFMELSERLEREQVLRINDSISGLKEARPKPKIEFISNAQIQFMFSNQIQYEFETYSPRDYFEYEFIAPLIWSLAYDCGFEQKHLFKLELTDVDEANYRIRNIRRDKNPDLIEWMELNARTYYYLKRYLGSRRQSENEKLLLIEDRVLEAKDINKTFDILNRGVNKRGFPKGCIEDLVRAGILRSLLDSNGQSLLKHTMFHGTGNNGQLIHAIEAYQRSLSDEQSE